MVSGLYMFCNNYSSQSLQLVPSLLLTGEKEVLYTRPTMVTSFCISLDNTICKVFSHDIMSGLLV